MGERARRGRWRLPCSLRPAWARRRRAAPARAPPALPGAGSAVECRCSSRLRGPAVRGGLRARVSPVPGGAPGFFYFSWFSYENRAKSRSPRGWRAERGGGSRERRLEAADLDREAPEVTAPGAGGAAPLRWRRAGGGGGSVRSGPVLSRGLSSVCWPAAASAATSGGGGGCSTQSDCGCCGSL